MRTRHQHREFFDKGSHPRRMSRDTPAGCRGSNQDRGAPPIDHRIRRTEFFHDD